MEQIIFLVNLAIAVGGAYMALESFKMKRTNKIAGQIFLSNDLQIRKCKKEAEYCQYMAPKGMITGVITCILSGLAALGYFVPACEFFKNWSFVAILALYAWFLSYTGKANKTYF